MTLYRLIPLLLLLTSCLQQKAPKPVTVSAPVSVTSSISPSQSILINLNKNDYAVIVLGDSVPKMKIFEALPSFENYGFTPSQVAQLNTIDTLNFVLKDLKSAISKSSTSNKPIYSGISIRDTLQSELSIWLTAFIKAYGSPTLLEQHLLINPIAEKNKINFKNINSLLRQSGILRFRITTENP